MAVFYKYWNVNPRQEWVRESVAEFLGTFIFIFIGNCAVAQNVLSNGSAGNFVTVYFGYALGIFIGVLISAGVSGGHLNPAVTVAGAFMKKVDWSKVPHYLFAQYLGGFVAAAGTYFLYFDGFHIHHQHGANLTTAGIFATYPRPGLSLAGGFVDQVLGTMVLLIAIYAIMDKKNSNVPLQLVPLYVALVILAIACAMGFNEGFAINPARDLAPRLFTYLMGWGDKVFGVHSFWFVPVLGSHIGAWLGASIYVVFIERMRLSDEPDLNNQFNIQIIEKKIPRESVDDKHGGPSEKKMSVDEKSNNIKRASETEKFTYRL